MTEYNLPPDAGDIETVARRAIASLPADIRRHLDTVILRVEEFPDAEIEDEMGLESPFDLLGLYRGIDIGHKLVEATPSDVDMIFLFRRPILDYWCEVGENLVHIVRHVLIHEVGHHLGLSDEDMARIEDGQWGH